MTPKPIAQRKQALRPSLSPTPKTPARLPLIAANTIKVRPLKWLWYPYMPDHAASLLFGPGGHGKSHITVDIAARISQGHPLPGEDGKVKRPPQRVLMMSAEDELDTVLVPRLIAAEADLTMIAFPADLFTIDENGLKRVERYIKEFKPKVVVIDPIVHFMGGKVDMFRSNEVREVMGGLHQIAIRTGTAILIVGHTRKGSEGEDYERAMGAADFTNAVRSALFVTKNPDGIKVLRHVKTNYAPLGPSIPYAFSDGSMEWGEPFEESGKQSKADPAGEKIGKQKYQAISFLKIALKAGPMAAKELEALAKDEGIAPRTLARAKPGLVESVAQRIDGKMVWIWKLIGENNGPEVHSVENKGWSEVTQSEDGGHVDIEIHSAADSEAGGTVSEVADARRPEFARSLNQDIAEFMASRKARA